MEKEYTQKYLQINRNKNVIFTGAEIPSLSVLPELSELAESEGVSREFSSQYPAIIFSKACLADGAVIIQNVPSNNNIAILEEVRRLNEATTVTVQALDAESMTLDLVELLKPVESLSSKTLFVFPGNGSLDVYAQLSRLTSNELFQNAAFISTNRTMTKPGKFNLSVDYSTLPTDNFQNAIIVDDVIASGQTASTIAFDLKYYYPNISVSLASWIMLSPTERNKGETSGVRFVDRTFTSIALKGNYTSRPPINSLSTFLEDDNFSKEKTASYAQKYVANLDVFSNRLRRIKEAI